jgi:hypothetical protein
MGGAVPVIARATTERGPLVLDGTMFVKERYLEMPGSGEFVPTFLGGCRVRPGVAIHSF